MDSGVLVPLIIAALGSPVLLKGIEVAYRLITKKPALDSRLNSIELKLQRLEVLRLLSLSDSAPQVVCEAYDEYKRLGGNSYIDIMFQDWKTKTGFHI